MERNPEDVVQTITEKCIATISLCHRISQQLRRPDRFRADVSVYILLQKLVTSLEEMGRFGINILDEKRFSTSQPVLEGAFKCVFDGGDLMYMSLKCHTDEYVRMSEDMREIDAKVRDFSRVFDNI